MDNNEYEVIARTADGMTFVLPNVTAPTIKEALDIAIDTHSAGFSIGDEESLGWVGPTNIVGFMVNVIKEPSRVITLR